LIQHRSPPGSLYQSHSFHRGNTVGAIEAEKTEVGSSEGQGLDKRQQFKITDHLGFHRLHTANGYKDLMVYECLYHHQPHTVMPIFTFQWNLPVLNSTGICQYN